MKETLQSLPTEAEENIAQLGAGQDSIEVTRQLASSADAVAEVRGVEAQEHDPRLTALKAQYEALPEEDRTYASGVMTWEQVVAAIPNLNEFLDGVDSISEPEVYWIDGDGQLVVGDRCSKPAEETLGLDYYQSVAAAKSVPNRGLITLDEYKRYKKKHIGRFGQYASWVYDGENRMGARFALWNKIVVRVYRCTFSYREDGLGSCRVLRVKLNLES